MKKRIHVIYLLLYLVVNFIGAQRQMEQLNRGVVAYRSGANAVFVSWRLLKIDGYNTGFNLYRDGVKLNTTPLLNRVC